MGVVAVLVGEIFVAIWTTLTEVICRLAWKVWTHSCTIPAPSLAANCMPFWIGVWLFAAETIGCAEYVAFFPNAVKMLVMEVEQYWRVIFIRTIAEDWLIASIII
jgi:hypothetical protein